MDLLFNVMSCAWPADCDRGTTRCSLAGAVPNKWPILGDLAPFSSFMRTENKVLPSQGQT